MTEVPRVAADFAGLISDGVLNLPLPGSGRTQLRWHALAGIAREDLCVARLAEAHTDAVAILAELHGPSAGTDQRWGVWAAEPPDPVLRAEPGEDGWRLYGSKQWCSGAQSSTHALVTARIEDRRALFAVDLGQSTVHPVPDTWLAVGMAGSDSGEIRFDGTGALPVGAPGDYLTRPGFWHGGLGVAACWFGGACGIADILLRRARAQRADEHALAHLGVVDAALHGARAALRAAAAEVDDDPDDESGTARCRALRVRAVVEEACRLVLDRVGRATGAGPLGNDRAHARRVADLTVYLRQSHAEGDLAEIGRDLGQGTPPSW